MSGAARSANLDIKADLSDSLGGFMASAKSSTSLNASFSLYVAAGSYTLAVDGVGNGDLVISDYGSLSKYTIARWNNREPGRGSTPGGSGVGGTPTSGAAPLAVSFNGSGSYDPEGSVTSSSWNFGDGGSAGTSIASRWLAAKGVSTAVLTVTDEAGFSDTRGCRRRG